jgi:transcriptional regulator with XRE-family HTH domain
VGLSANAIWEIENGLSPLDADELALLGEALDVHPGAFFDEGPFFNWPHQSFSSMHNAMLARSIDELTDEDRDVVTRLVILLGYRRNSLTTKSV